MHGIGSARVSAQNDHLQLFIDAQQAPRRLQAVHAGEIDVHQDHVHLAEPHCRQHLLHAARLRNHGDIRLVAEQTLDAVAHECLLIRYHDMNHVVPPITPLTMLLALSSVGRRARPTKRPGGSCKQMVTAPTAPPATPRRLLIQGRESASRSRICSRSLREVAKFRRTQSSPPLPKGAPSLRPTLACSRKYS